ncbi:unnamed protein product [Rotaria socialis]
MKTLENSIGFQSVFVCLSGNLLVSTKKKLLLGYAYYSNYGEKVEQDGWYKWFMKNYILKVFGSEYPDEQKKID